MKDKGGYVEQVARILKPGGLFVVQSRRTYRPKYDAVPVFDVFPKAMRKYFEVSPVLPTHLAQIHEKRKNEPHAKIVVAVARRRSPPASGGR